MAVKTITIDVEAYELLSRKKREGQSFSQVIKEHFTGRPTGKDLKVALRGTFISEDALDAIEEQGAQHPISG
jgi:predicted CopG family antitoxin